MSYYAKPSFSLTTHAIERIKQRLKLQGDVVDIIKQLQILYKNAIFDFQGRDGTIFLKINDKRYKNMYFVISSDNVIITVTPISYAKKITLI